MNMFKNLKKRMRTFISRYPSLDRFVRLHYFRNYRARKYGYPRWDAITSAHPGIWDKARRQAAETGPRVLIATSIGAYLAGTTLESALAAALTLRGAQVHVLLCDSALPACHDCNSSWYPRMEPFVAHGPRRDLCRVCFDPARKMYESLGATIHRYGDFLFPEDYKTAEEIASKVSPSTIKSFRIDDVPVGEHALAGTLRFFARASLEGEPFGGEVLQRYLKAAILTFRATQRLLDQSSFECAVFHHGIYVPQGIIAEVVRRKNMRLVNWNPAYRKKCFIFSHGGTYHHALMNEPVEQWENLPWDEAMQKELGAYLNSRWHGSQDWIWFHENPHFDLKELAGLGVDPSKPCVGLLTNVMWDAQLHYPANAFSSMLEWLSQTISYFSKRPDLQLLIRVHPAEIRGTLVSRQPVLEEIQKAFPQLPKNIFVIGPESNLSTYSAMSPCNAVIIYGTKTGVELATRGLPVIVAGEAWIRNKGITFDASTAEAYFKLLDQLPFLEKMSDARRKRAEKYAYHFFFRRMIPLDFMEAVVSDSPYRLGPISLDALLPGRNRGLDVICDGILKGSEFIYPAEDVHSRSASSRPIGETLSGVK